MSNFSTKIASTASVVALVATAMSASLVSAASEFLPYAELLADNSVIGVQSNESGYRLGDTVTRAELAKITANIGGYTSTACAGTTYGDVGAKLGDLCGAIEALAEAGVVSTANANFRPNASVTRAEAVKMLLGAVGEAGSSTAAGYMDIDNLGDLAMYINRANELGCAADATYFRPNATSSRGEAFKVAACVAGYEATTPTVPPVTGTGVTATGVVTTGNVSVAIEGTAVAQYVPANASSVDVGKFKITANGGDVTVSSVTVGRSGLGNSQNVTLSLAQNKVRISESRTINTSTQEGIIRLNTPVVLKKGESVVLTLLVSVSTQANAQHQFAVKAVNGVVVSNVTLGLLNTTSYEVAKTTVDTVTLRSVSSGRNDQNFASVTLRAGNQDTSINGFTLTKTAGIDLTRALSNVQVYKNGVKVGSTSVTSDKIYVSGLASDLTRNNSAVYDLRADVIYVGDGSSTDDIVLNITETEDVSAVEKSTGYATETKLYTLGGGAKVDLSDLDIVLTKKATSSLTVSPGASSVILLDGTINSSASFDISDFTLTRVAYPVASSSGVFSALTLTVNGVDYDLVDANGNVSASYNYNKSGDKFRVDSASPVNVQLRATLLNGAPNGSLRYTLTLNTAKNLTTGNTVALIGKTLNGDTLTVSAPTLKIRQATVSAPTSSKIFSNATDLEIGRFGVEAKADEVSVNKITITNIAPGNITDLTKLISGSSAKLIGTDGSTIASSATVTATGIEFRSVTLRVAKDTTTNVRLVVTTLSDLNSVVSLAALGGNSFVAQVNIANIDLSSANSAAPTMVSNAVTPDVNKVYTVSTQPPTVKVTPMALIDNGAVAKVTVTNIDPDLDLSLSGAELRVSFRSTANGTAPAISGVCLRNVGSSAACNSGLAGVLVGTESPTGTFTYVITGSTLAAASSISKNLGTVDFEVFIPNAPVWVTGDNVSVSLQKLYYVPDGLATASESYIGLANASAVSVK